MSTPTGLRDQKKAATRLALSEAAIRLAKPAGLGGVTAEAIAAEAGVSTRTFHNYFASKEEAVLYRFEADVAGWVERLYARPLDEPIWDSLEAIVLSIVLDPVRDLEDVRAEMMLIEDSPALLARHIALHGRVTRTLGEAIAARTGTDVDTDLYPNVLQMAVGTAAKSAIELWLGGNTGHPTPEPLVRETFAMLRAGLPQPTPRRPPAARPAPPVP
ncbi:TetR/AcrR family transcriptional regulator [Rhodococcus sp. NPDC058505]|uniref:TetR/AcrR family transcriptional regulator n=1 Tax=unclassified Rhodococcus (in: high G+C Gram-positive bacteria) TaxID=192944 RepID=UPI003666C474